MFRVQIIFCALFGLCLASCSIRPSDGFQRWIDGWKEYGLTQMASETTGTTWTEEERANILVLLLDLDEATTCSKLKKIIETDEFLKTIEEKNNFNEGFLFDALYDYDYEQNIWGMSRSSRKNDLDRWAFMIVGTWKTEFSIERINSVIGDITYCYPY